MDVSRVQALGLGRFAMAASGSSCGLGAGCVHLSYVAQSCLILRPHGLWPARLLCPWDSAGKNARVSCHFLLQSTCTLSLFPPNKYLSCFPSFCLCGHSLLQSRRPRALVADHWSTGLYGAFTAATRPQSLVGDPSSAPSCCHPRSNLPLFLTPAAATAVPKTTVLRACSVPSGGSNSLRPHGL